MGSLSGELLVGHFQMGLHGLQGFDMAGTGQIQAFGGGLPARDFQQALAQRIQAIAGAR